MTRLIVERGLGVAMRDDTALCAEVFRPDVDAQLPCILFRTPYGRLRPDVVSPIDPLAEWGCNGHDFGLK